MQILPFEMTENWRPKLLKQERETSCNAGENNDTNISSFFLFFGRNVSNKIVNFYHSKMMVI